MKGRGSDLEGLWASAAKGEFGNAEGRGEWEERIFQRREIVLSRKHGEREEKSPLKHSEGEAQKGCRTEGTVYS